MREKEKKIAAKIIKQSILSSEDRLELFEIYDQYYENTNYNIFNNDLKNKDFIIVILNKNGEIAGFTTIKLVKLEVGKIDHLYLYSGDTIVKEEIRNNPVLAGAFIHFMMGLIKYYSNYKIQWFLISKGYRTYRFLQVYFKNFFPAYNMKTPHNYKQSLNTIATYLFGDEYDRNKNIIYHKTERDRLKPEHADIKQNKLKNPHIKYFFNINPNYHLGDELACITDIDKDNFKPLLYRVLNSSAYEVDFDFVNLFK